MPRSESIPKLLRLRPLRFTRMEFHERGCVTVDRDDGTVEVLNRTPLSRLAEPMPSLNGNVVI